MPDGIGYLLQGAAKGLETGVKLGLLQETTSWERDFDMFSKYVEAGQQIKDPIQRTKFYSDIHKTGAFKERPRLQTFISTMATLDNKAHAELNDTIKKIYTHTQNKEFKKAKDLIFELKTQNYKHGLAADDLIKDLDDILDESQKAKAGHLYQRAINLHKAIQDPNMAIFIRGPNDESIEVNKEQGQARLSQILSDLAENDVKLYQDFQEAIKPQYKPISRIRAEEKVKAEVEKEIGQAELKYTLPQKLDDLRMEYNNLESTFTFPFKRGVFGQIEFKNPTERQKYNKFIRDFQRARGKDIQLIKQGKEPTEIDKIREQYFKIDELILPPEARARLKEGIETTFRNGQVWTLQNGEPVRIR